MGRSDARICLKIANILQVLSYISLMTAWLSIVITTQAQNNYQESVCLKRSVAYNVGRPFLVMSNYRTASMAILLKRIAYLSPPRKKLFWMRPIFFHSANIRLMLTRWT